MSIKFAVCGKQSVQFGAVGKTLNPYSGMFKHCSYRHSPWLICGLLIALKPGVSTYME